MGLDKTLVYPDGRQVAARLGMVDSRGVFVTMYDADGRVSERLAYESSGHIIAETEAELRDASELAEHAMGVADRCLAMAARMHRMYADAVAEGSYPRGRKGRVKEGVARYRRELEDLRKEADW